MLWFQTRRNSKKILFTISELLLEISELLLENIIYY